MIAIAEKPYLIGCGDPRFPGALSDLPRPPAELWAIGDAGVLAQSPARFVAIVGTREASPYGLRVAKALGRAFVEAGLADPTTYSH